ncbi:MAG TPA: hypothetical protein DCS43_03335 [Verrucomicrobia bacterium]|nr:hypothetical protein [Verrucomicrobiota bacterium]
MELILNNRTTQQEGAQTMSDEAVGSGEGTAAVGGKVVGGMPMPPIFSQAELMVVYRGLMDLPLRRSDPQFAASESAIGKIAAFAQAGQAAMSGAR